MLGKFMATPTKHAWTALKHLARYVHGTTDLCIEFRRSPPATNPIVGYVDSDWGGDPDNGRSTTGYVFHYCGSVVDWRSTQQTLVAMSTMESELVALTTASLNAIYLRALATSFGFPPTGPTVMHEDNRSAITVANSTTINRAPRHIARRHFKVRELIHGTHGEAPSITVEYIKSALNTADLLTKSLTTELFQRHRSSLVVQRADRA